MCHLHHHIIQTGTWLSLGQLWKVYISYGNGGRGKSLQWIQPIVQSEENNVISQNRWTIEPAHPIQSEQVQAAGCDLVRRLYAKEVH